jgi:hypothetical protein
MLEFRYSLGAILMPTMANQFKIGRLSELPGYLSMLDDCSGAKNVLANGFSFLKCARQFAKLSVSYTSGFRAHTHCQIVKKRILLVSGFHSITERSA